MTGGLPSGGPASGIAIGGIPVSGGVSPEGGRWGTSVEQLPTANKTSQDQQAIARENRRDIATSLKCHSKDR
jgi:hypothetical protein